MNLIWHIMDQIRYQIMDQIFDQIMDLITHKVLNEMDQIIAEHQIMDWGHFLWLLFDYYLMYLIQIIYPWFTHLLLVCFFMLFNWLIVEEMTIYWLGTRKQKSDCCRVIAVKLDTYFYLDSSMRFLKSVPKQGLQQCHCQGQQIQRGWLSWVYQSNLKQRKLLQHTSDTGWMQAAAGWQPPTARGL